MNYAQSYRKQSYYIEKPRYSSFFILRCTTTLYCHGKKSSSITVRVCSLMPDHERSIESAMKYCENEASSKPAELILLNGKVVGPCELVLNFGKYAGRKVADVKEQDPRYLRYLYTSNLAARDFITMKLKYFLASWFGTVSAAAPG